MYQCLISERVLPLWAGPAGVFFSERVLPALSSPKNDTCIFGGPPSAPSPVHGTCSLSFSHVEMTAKLCKNHKYDIMKS